MALGIRNSAPIPTAGRRKMEKDHRSAPDPIVTLSDGAEIRLSRLWQDQPLVLVFLRHFG